MKRTQKDYLFELNELKGKIENILREENTQETIQHLGELCYDNGITENDIWNFIRDKKSKEDFLWTD